MPTGKGIFKLSLGKDHLAAKTRIWVCVKMEFCSVSCGERGVSDFALVSGWPIFQLP